MTSFRRNEELEVALDIHDRLEPLDCEADGKNPWGISYSTLFNSTTDSDNFSSARSLRLTVGPWAPTACSAAANEEALPLYEGQLANRYDHRAKTYEGYSGNKYGRKPNLPQPTNKQKADPAFEIEPRYWMPRPVVAARLAARVGDRAMFAFRDVGAPWTNQRSAKGALIPRAASDAQDADIRHPA